MARSKFHNGRFIGMEDTLEDELEHIKNIPDYIEVDKELEYKKAYDIWINSNRVATENEVEAIKREFSPTADTKEKTLYDELESIEEIPDFVDIDKGKAYTVVLDRWGRKNQLVDRALKGEISISDIVLDLSKKYQCWRDWLPIQNDQKTLRKYRQLGLHELFYTPDDSPKSKAELYFGNPVGSAVATMGFATVVTMAISIFSGEYWASYLTFNDILIKFGLMGGMFGVIGRKIFDTHPARHIQTIDTIKDANYIQTAINKYKESRGLS